MRTLCPKIIYQSEATHCLIIIGNIIYNTFVTYVLSINAVILCMLVQFLTVAIPVNAYKKKLSAIK